MERWEGKVTVVTGASAGIGVSIATELVERGMVVVGIARRVERVQELSEALAGKKGKLYALKADVGKEEDVVEAFQWIREKLGTVHVLVNNAGYGPFCHLSQLKREDYGKIRTAFDTNVVGLIMCTNEAIRLMKESGVEDGHIFNINSIAGHVVGRRTGFYAYNASKHAVTVITEGLRRELVEAKSQIRVTSISPGAVLTEFAKSSGRANPEEVMKAKPTLESKNVTDSLIHVLASPPNVQISELTILPVGELY